VVVEDAEVEADAVVVADAEGEEEAVDAEVAVADNLAQVRNLVNQNTLLYGLSNQVAVMHKAHLQAMHLPVLQAMHLPVHRDMPVLVEAMPNHHHMFRLHPVHPMPSQVVVMQVGEAEVTKALVVGINRLLVDTKRHRADIRHHRADTRHHRADIRHHRADIRHHRLATKHQAAADISPVVGLPILQEMLLHPDQLQFKCLHHKLQVNKVASFSMSLYILHFYNYSGTSRARE
jgi:hypothetical protein